VKQLTMLVTSEGRWVLEDSDEFLAALGDPNPDYDGAMFAVTNLGFIKFQIFDESIIEVELHPHTVELPALLAVQQQLISTSVRLFRLKFLDTTWKSEIFPSSELAVSRLSELCARKFAPVPEGKFLVEQQNFFNLLESGESPLRYLAQKWRMSFGHFDPSVISFAIKHNLLSRLMIAGVSPGNPDPVFRFIGDGHANWLDNEFRFRAIGEKLENFPDKDYGKWISQYYKNVARTGEPRYDYVTAAIRQQPSTYLTHYERLLLPWKTPSDEILVTLSSRTVDARYQRSIEPPSVEIPVTFSSMGLGTDPNSISLSNSSSSEPESPAARKSARSQ
jgi:hypothetical protein